MSISLFGYFFYEIEGQETILVSPKADGSWDFSIHTRVQSVSEIKNALDLIVDSMIQRKIISSESILEISANQYLVTEIPNSGAHFVKIPVRKPLATSRDLWFGKAIFSQNRCASPKLLSLLMHDYIVCNDNGMKVLECVDAIVYRVQDNMPEFLLLRKNVPNSDEFKSEYPKGGLKFHETVKEGALRELIEETGVSSYSMKNYLGLKEVDVRERKREYDFLRVHGLAFEYHGSGDDIIPSAEEGFDQIYDWVCFPVAVEKIWMKTYGVEFLNSLQPLLP
jgi:8-oxo-dGTP pyrophosphatase MutT (NUDIX family)